MRHFLIVYIAALFFYGTMLFPKEANAAKIILKSGKEITAEIIEKTDTYIKVDYQGIPVYYELKYIAGIEEAQKLPDDNLSISDSVTAENKALKEEIANLKELLREMSIEHNI